MNWNFFSKLFKRKQHTDNTPTPKPTPKPTFYMVALKDVARCNFTTEQYIFQFPKPDTPLEALIRDNIDKIENALDMDSGYLVYMPYRASEILAKQAYNNPAKDWDAEVNAADLNTLLLDMVTSGDVITKPCLFHYKGKGLAGGEPFSNEHYIENYFNVATFEETDDLDSLIKQLKGLGVRKHYSDIMFSIVMPKKPAVQEPAPEYDADVEKLLNETKENIEKLRLLGVDELIIKSLCLGKPKLSKLLVTKDRRILLPDYNNMEIKMTPLVKAVYLFFLSHPEGVLLKNLQDYYPELRKWYLETTDRVDISRIDKNIAALTDPLNNSINEKCARIKEAFLSKFNDYLAKHYYVDSKGRGSLKAITLDRKLVSFE